MRLLLALVALFALMLGPAAAQPAEADIPGILARGRLRIAVPAFDAPPFFYGRDGALEGSDVDMARAVARELGVEPVFVRGGDSFDAVVDTLAAGGADVAICKLSRTLKRARAVTYTRPYLVLKHALALNRVAFAELARGGDAATVIRDFTGTLAVIRGSAFAGFAPINFPKAQIVEFPDWQATLTAVRTGGAIAAYRDEFEIKKILIDDPAASLTLRTVTLTDLTDTIGMAVPSTSPRLAGFLDMYVADKVADTSVDGLLKRYQHITHPEAATQ